ncbi:hypothetical protein MRB53_038904 [Persea americana]|nr:hypothetical protein MRB53_038904 [Persea americana]
MPSSTFLKFSATHSDGRIGLEIWWKSDRNRLSGVFSCAIVVSLRSQTELRRLAVLQRCLSGSVTVDSQVVSSIGKGIVVLAAIGPNDNVKSVETLAGRILKMKMWPDENNAQWKQNVQDIQGEVLCVSQFTLFASTRKGTKPDFHGAAKPEVAKELYDHFVISIGKLYSPEKVKDGVFQAMMEVALVNDGPVTLQMDSEETRRLGPNTPDTTPTTT